VLLTKERLTGTTTGFYEADVLPATQPIGLVSKHYRKTQWFGHLRLVGYDLNEKVTS